jgi:hypothetical protein
MALTSADSRTEPRFQINTPARLCLLGTQEPAWEPDRKLETALGGTPGPEETDRPRDGRTGARKSAKQCRAGAYYRRRGASRWKGGFRGIWETQRVGGTRGGKLQGRF